MNVVDRLISVVGAADGVAVGTGGEGVALGAVGCYSSINQEGVLLL